jgi:glyoxylase-like metal-dependent hydrolase (beta-lactamase superfamily II)
VVTHIHLDHAGGTGDIRPATPPPDFELDVALASLRTFAALQPARLLFSHFGPVTAVREGLERSADELHAWLAETRRARGAGVDLDHAAAMVAERTRQRYAALDPDADPRLVAKVERMSGTTANVAGIMRWLDKSEGAGQ